MKLARTPVVLFLILAAIAGLTAIVTEYKYVNPDTAQHISVARNLLEGEGLSTSILYYEEQYAMGVVPAPQTLWPPGYPVSVAALMLLGLSELAAAFLLAIIGHLGTAWLLFIIGKQIGMTNQRALTLSGAWLLLAAPATLVIAAFTEPLYTALTLLAVWAWLRSDGGHDYTWMLIAGSCAACAFTVRYIGITFIVAVAAVLTLRFVLEPNWRRLISGVCFISVPVLVCTVLFWRNLTLTGDVTGGPEVWQGDHWLDTFKAFYWASLTALGIYGQGLVSWLAEHLVLLLAAMSTFLSVPLLVSKRRILSDKHTALSWLTLFYCLATGVLLLSVAMERSADLIQWRYLTPLIPFIILQVAMSIESPWIKGLAGPFRIAGYTVGVAALVFLLLSQFRVLVEWDQHFVNARAARALSEALDEPVQGVQLREFFEGRIAPHDVVLTQDGQVLGAFVEQPILGLTSAYYTSYTWTPEKVLELVDQYDVRWVIFLPRLLHWEGKNDNNKLFFRELELGNVPPWLRLVGRSAEAEIYAVEAESIRDVRE